MDKKLFEISCTTCEARFGVMDPSLIGEIVACPKCGGMILVEKPLDYDQVAPAPDHSSIPDDSPSVSVQQPENAGVTDGIESLQTTIDSTKTSTDDGVSSRPTPQEVLPLPQHVPFPSADSPIATEPPVLSKLDSTGPPPHSVAVPPAVVSSIPLPLDNAMSSQLHPGETPPVLKDEIATESNLWNNKLLLVLIGVTCVLFIAVALLLLLRVTPTRTPDTKQTSPVTTPLDEAIPPAVDNKTEPLPPSDKTPDAPEPKTDPDDKTSKTASVTSDVQGQDGTEQSFMTVPNVTGTSTTLTESKKSGKDPSTDESSQPVSPGPATMVPPTDKTIPARPENSTTLSGAASPTTVDKKTIPAAKTQSEEDKSKEPKEDEEEFTLGDSGNTQASLLKSLQPFKKGAPDVDIKSRLSQSLSSIEFSGQPLSATIRILSGLSGVPIVFDLDCMEQIRPICPARIQFRLEGKTIRECLEETAKLSKLVLQEKENRIVLTVPDKNAMVAASFDLSNLASGGPGKTDTASTPNRAEPRRALSTTITQDELTRLVKDMVAPATWDSKTEKGSLRWEKKSLHINQTVNCNMAVKRLFEQLRSIRHLSPQVDMIPELLVPEITCWDKLSQTMSLTYFESVPLMDPLGLIASENELEILFDDAELARKGINRQSSANVRVNDIPVDQVLSTLLTPLQLDYIVLGANLILITSREAALEYKTFEVHLFAPPDIAKPDESHVRSLVERIKTSVSPSAWKSDQDFIWYDMTSCCLLIRQSQPVQRQIRGWLERHVQKQLQPVTGETLTEANQRNDPPKTQSGPDAKAQSQDKSNSGKSLSGAADSGSMVPTQPSKPTGSAAVNSSGPAGPDPNSIPASSGDKK